MGKGAARIVKSSSEEEKSSIGYIVASVDMSDVRMGGRRFRTVMRLFLNGEVNVGEEARPG